MVCWLQTKGGSKSKVVISCHVSLFRWLALVIAAQWRSLGRINSHLTWVHFSLSYRLQFTEIESCLSFSRFAMKWATFLITLVFHMHCRLVEDIPYSFGGILFLLFLDHKWIIFTYIVNLESKLTNIIDTFPCILALELFVYITQNCRILLSSTHYW